MPLVGSTSSHRRRNVGSALDGYAETLVLHYDPTFLGCVAHSGAVNVDRVVAFVERKIIAVRQSHAENQSASGALEQLKKR